MQMMHGSQCSYLERQTSQGINKSPGEILNGRKYRTGLPMIDVHRKSTEDEIEKLSEKHSKMACSNNGKEFAKLPGMNQSSI